MTKNILVTDANGNVIGTTYPKRASGLIKNGRACLVDGCTIRMFAEACASDNNKILEDTPMNNNFLTFNGNEWLRANADFSFINDFDGSLTQAAMLGDWNNYAEIFSKPMSLQAGNDYHFAFWINGGENEKGDELCQFRIIFNDDKENCNIYKLNRNFISPLLHQKGWELYDIPFSTPAYISNTDINVTFSFACKKAPMAIKAAKDLSLYSDMKDEPDEFAAYRPQRHNLVFADGWPSISQYGGSEYSTQAIREKLAKERGHRPPFGPGHPGIPPMPGMPPMSDMPPFHGAPFNGFGAEYNGFTNEPGKENLGPDENAIIDHLLRSAQNTMNAFLQNMARHDEVKNQTVEKAQRVREAVNKLMEVDRDYPDDETEEQVEEQLDEIENDIDDIEDRLGDVEDEASDLRDEFSDMKYEFDDLSRWAKEKYDEYDPKLRRALAELNRKINTSVEKVWNSTAVLGDINEMIAEVFAKITDSNDTK